jgi:ABC-type polysaccharide/polyol phosphate transport system ATPase subunit
MSGATITERAARAEKPGVDPDPVERPTESGRNDAADEPMLRVRSMGKRFRIFSNPTDRLWSWLGLLRVLRRPAPQDFWAVRGVGFDLRRGECLGIMGANGSGKSTLLKMITGALHATEGSCEVRGRVLSLIELGAGLHPLLSGRANIGHAASLLGFPPGYARRAMSRIEDFAELGDFLDRPVNMYSSGMKVRLAFSMFACFEPDLFIVDEALSVGDVFFQQKCVARLREMLAGGMTMLFVSHDQGAVLNLCHRAIVLSQGRSIFEGTPEEAVSRYLSTMRGSRWAGGTTSAGSASIGGAIEVKPEPNARARDAQREIIARDVVRDRATSRHGQGGLRIVAARVTDGAGNDTLECAVGRTLTFHVLLEANQPVASPRCGVRIFDRFNNMIFAAGTANVNAALPPLETGDRLIVEIHLTLDVEAGQYTFGLGAGEPYAGDPAQGVHHDRLDRLGPLVVHEAPDEPRRFYGMARLPMRATLVARISAMEHAP